VLEWNSAMMKLGLRYWFYGTMDWSLGTKDGYKGLKTLALFGKRFLGFRDR